MLRAKEEQSGLLGYTFSVGKGVFAHRFLGHLVLG